MSVHFDDRIEGGIRLKHSERSPASIPFEDLRHVIHELNLISDHLGCVVMGSSRNYDTDVVIFAGNLERFSMLSAASKLAARVFYFQDTSSWWYDGSTMLPDITRIADFLREHVGRRRCLVFGQSSGGYAALVVGGMNSNYDVLACSPQIFSDATAKRRIHISPSLAVQHTPDYLLDIEKLYLDTSRSGLASAIFSASEHSNPLHSHFWLDHLHLAKAIRIPSIDIYLAASNNHSIVFQRAAAFSDLLQKLVAASGKSIAKRRILVEDFVASIKQDVT